MIILDSLSFCSFSVQRYNFSFAVANLFHLFLLLVFIYFQITKKWKLLTKKWKLLTKR